MPRILPRPFDDLVDLRTDDQRQADALRTGEQREQLLSLQNDDNQAELVRILQERRAANTDAVVRFEMAERPLPPALVVPREILLRSDPNQDFAAADEILRAAGFEPRDLVDQPIESAELAARLRSFTGPADANLDLVLNTVGQLTDAGFEAAPTAVLVQHPVVKNNAGPAPSQPDFPDSLSPAGRQDRRRGDRHRHCCGDPDGRMVERSAGGGLRTMSIPWTLLAVTPGPRLSRLRRWSWHLRRRHRSACRSGGRDSLVSGAGQRWFRQRTQRCVRDDSCGPGRR